MSVSLTYLDHVTGKIVYVNDGATPLPVSATVTVDSVTITGSLPAGTNVIGHVISDTGSTTTVTQATAANLNATVVGTGTFAVQNVEVGDSYAHITTSTTTVVKNSAGTIKKVSVNSLGTVASTVTIQDNATVLAVINSLALSGTWNYNIACATNITVITTGTTPPDVTVTYR